MVEPVKGHTICTRHLVDNLHLHRRQIQIHVIHPRRGNLSRLDLKEELARKFHVSDTQTIFISGYQTKFSFSNGFDIIYDSVQDTLKNEPTHCLSQNGLKAHVDKTTKNSSNRAKKIRGIKTTKKKFSIKTWLSYMNVLQHASSM